MEAILRLASRQFGLFTRRQWLAAGLTARQLQYKLSTGKIRAVHPGVYVVRGSAPSFQQDVMAACLAVDGVASSRCAATLWKFRKFERPVVEVLVTKAHTPRLSGVVVRRTGLLAPSERTHLGAIPITSRARTLLDVASVAPERVEGAVDGALHRKQVRLSALRLTLERAGARHPGRPLFERLVIERVNGRRPTESELEDDLLAVLRRYGLPEPVPQHEVNGRRIDLAYPDLVLGIEADSVEAHSAKEDVQRNATKANDLLEWRILHFTWEDVHTRPAEVAERVRHAIARRRTAPAAA